MAGQIVLDCNVSLSKKLRPLIGPSGNATLVITRLIEGKGEGRLILVSDQDEYSLEDIEKLMNAETSIMLTPTAQVEGVYETSKTGNLFADTDPSLVAQRIATTEAPDKANRKHILKYQNVDIPELAPLKDQSDQPLLQTTKKHTQPACITNFEELTVALKQSISQFDVPSPNTSGMNERESAVALEEWESMAGIDVPCYIVNDSCMTLVVNDIDRTLEYNMPVDLRNIAAKKLLLSKDLREILRNKFAKFISVDEVPKYETIAQELAQTTYQTADVYDNHAEAMSAVEADGFSADGTSTSVQATQMSIDNLSQLEADTDEEAMMRNLTGQMNAPMPDGGVELSGSARRTEHSNKSRGDAFSEFSSPVKKMGQADGGVVRRRDS